VKNARCSFRDPNKIVAVAVLSSPKADRKRKWRSIAKMANVSDEILRMIGFSRAWTKELRCGTRAREKPEDPGGDLDDYFSPG
jgi:hypothetical protein